MTVDTTTPGQILIKGNLGTLEPGDQLVIDYSIQIAGISRPGVFTVFNMAAASATGTQATDKCSTTINAVQLNTQKCCTVNDNSVTYRIRITSVGLSPNVLVNLLDSLFIPSGVTVRFTGFSDCTATFANTQDIVPLGVDITGPVQILITCNSLLIPQSGSIHKHITFIFVSSSVVGAALIENSVQSVTPTNPDNQIFLGAGSLPVQANIGVQLSLICNNPCIEI